MGRTGVPPVMQRSVNGGRRSPLFITNPPCGAVRTRVYATVQTQRRSLLNDNPSPVSLAGQEKANDVP
jgi:hypothetical protein